jgi:hypothetical protein
MPMCVSDYAATHPWNSPSADKSTQLRSERQHSTLLIRRVPVALARSDCRTTNASVAAQSAHPRPVCPRNTVREELWRPRPFLGCWRYTILVLMSLGGRKSLAHCEFGPQYRAVLLWED